MKIVVEFDSEDEFKARIKNPRGGKADKEDEASVTGQAPAPIMPQPQFTPPGQQQQPAGGNPFAATAGDPAVAALVGRIAARIDSAIASGQPADQALAWFRGQCGAEASAATMEQIKSIFLPKMAVAGLENIAKLMNA